MITVGNQVALNVVDVTGNQMSVNTTPYTVQSVNSFTATAGNVMSATVNGVTYTSNVETGADSLQSLADQINNQLGPFSEIGLVGDR